MEEDMKWLIFLIATITACLVLPCVAQNAAAPKPTLGPSAALLASWNEIGRKRLQHGWRAKYEYRLI
jgi:hypothetical protein